MRFCFGVAGAAAAQANLQINTPAVSALRGSLKEKHGQLLPFYSSGAVGLTRDGNIALRDANAVPLAQRAQVNALIAGGNQDRAELYREIARANGKPEWENDIRNDVRPALDRKSAAGLVLSGCERRVGAKKVAPL